MMTPYYSFLLRMWPAGSAEKPCWRVSLENPHTREMQGFESLEGLLEYLQKLTAETELPGPARANGEKLLRRDLAGPPP